MFMYTYHSEHVNFTMYGYFQQKFYRNKKFVPILFRIYVIKFNDVPFKLKINKWRKKRRVIIEDGCIERFFFQVFGYTVKFSVAHP